MTKKIFLNEPEYERSRWCYDTPGTIQKDQILDLLTTDELLLTLPQEIITPRTFMLKPKQTIFVAGMGRLDYLEGEYFIRYTHIYIIFIFFTAFWKIVIMHLENY